MDCPRRTAPVEALKLCDESWPEKQFPAAVIVSASWEKMPITLALFSHPFEEEAPKRLQTRQRFFRYL
jgi:hypothetical protein